MLPPKGNGMSSDTDLRPPSSSRNVIVICAIAGAVHVPSQSPYLPITAEQIVDRAVGTAEAGASILHLHARQPDTGRPTADPDALVKFIPAIRERTDAVINITTGGGQGMTIELRLPLARGAVPPSAARDRRCR